MSTPLPDIPPNDPLQNALLSSIMSGQSGVPGNLDLQSLLAAQATGGQAGGLDWANLLAMQANAGGDPMDDRLNIALRWLEQRRSAEQSTPVEEELSEAELELQRLEEMRQQRERQEEKREKLRELKDVMNALYAELETLRARNDELAAALGACYLCFGEDIACPECGGQGGSGSFVPDEAAFRQYVAPAINHVRAIQRNRPAGKALRAGKEAHSQGNQPVPQSD